MANNEILTVKLPNICQNELVYIVEILLDKFLGIKFEYDFYEGKFIEIKRKKKIIENFSKLTIDNSFFHKADQHWLELQSMPVSPLKNWIVQNDGITEKITEKQIPVLYGSPGLIKNSNHIHLNLDIFGSIFFMLSRYEEIVIKKRDQHDRFSAYSSHALINNYLNRPLVDEYVEILKQSMRILWPDLKFEEKKFIINTSHDVDQISRYQTRKSFYEYLRAIGGDLMRGYIKDFICSPISYFNNKTDLSLHDPYNTFDWLMDISEKNNLKSTFNFICGKSKKFNSDYNIEDIKVKNLIKKISERGHIIGLHPSYDCYNNPKLIKKELEKLIFLMRKLEINQEKISSRMHYLKFKINETLLFLNEAGIYKDTTIGYNDQIGFRCGTSQSYQGYNLVDRIKLDIIIEPLIIMDVTLFDKQYLNLEFESAFDLAIDLKNKCKRMNIEFNILWHNSFFQDHRQKDFYVNLIRH